MSWKKPVDPLYEAIKVTLTPANWKLSFKNLAACSQLSMMKAEMSKEFVTLVLLFDDPLSLSSIYGLGTFNSLEVCTKEYLQCTEPKFVDYEESDDMVMSTPLIARPPRPALRESSELNKPVTSCPPPIKLKRSISVIGRTSPESNKHGKILRAANLIGVHNGNAPEEILRRVIQEIDDEDTDCDLS